MRGRAGRRRAGATARASERAKTEFIEAAFSDAIAIYLLSLSVDFDYSELREREYPLLAPQALAERLRMIARAVSAECGLRVCGPLPARGLNCHSAGRCALFVRVPIIAPLKNSCDPGHTQSLMLSPTLALTRPGSGQAELCRNQSVRSASAEGLNEAGLSCGWR